MPRIETEEEAIGAYFRQMRKLGCLDLQIKQPNRSMVESTRDGFELWDGERLMAFIKNNGQMIDADEYLDDHPDCTAP